MRYSCQTIIPRPPPLSVMIAAALAQAILDALLAQRGRRGSHVVDAILDDFIANKDSALNSARFMNGPACSANSLRKPSSTVINGDLR